MGPAKKMLVDLMEAIDPRSGGNLDADKLAKTILSSKEKPIPGFKIVITEELTVLDTKCYFRVSLKNLNKENEGSTSYFVEGVVKWGCYFNQIRLNGAEDYNGLVNYGIGNNLTSCDESELEKIDPISVKLLQDFIEYTDGDAYSVSDLGRLWSCTQGSANYGHIFQVDNLSIESFGEEDCIKNTFTLTNLPKKISQTFIMYGTFSSWDDIEWHSIYTATNIKRVAEVYVPEGGDMASKLKYVAG